MPDNVLQAWRSGVLISVQEQRNAFTIHLITTLAHDVLTRFDTGIINISEPVITLP